jgi:mannonate dehydratase
LPGTVDDLTPAEFRRELDRYRDIGPDGLRAALVNFLHAVLPAAREAGITLAIHPDDPPRPLFGLPRVASTAADLEALFDAVPDSQNGLTFCSGSLGGRLDNDPVAIFRRFADRIPFAHFRNVECLSAERGAFRETGHLDGRVDMAALMAALVDEEARRRGAGREDWSIPVRPDHGRELIRDQGRGHYPGYPYEGRMVALAELRGLEAGIRHAVDRLRQPAGGSAKDAPAGRHRD